MVSFSTLLVVLCATLCVVDAIKPHPVLELLQQQVSKKAAPDCSTCNKPNQFCDYRSWTGVCKECPVCGIDHFCDGRGYCTRCPGVYLKVTQSCERVDVNDPKSEGNFVEGKPVKLAFATVGDDLFYLSALPNTTDPTATPSGNGTTPTPPPTPTPSANDTTPAPTPEAIDAILSITPSSHVIEEVTAGSGEYRVKFNDTLGGYLRIVLPATTSDEITDGSSPALIDMTTLGVAQILRDFSGFTTFGVEHSASFSWRFRVGSDDSAKYLAWCGQATCGMGVPALRLLSSMYCGSLTTSGIRCDVMITN